MSFFSNLWNKLFPKSAIKSLTATMTEFGLTKDHVAKVTEVVVSVAPTAVPGLQKATIAEDIVRQHADEWGLSQTVIDWVSLIVKLAWAIAKLSGKI